MNKTATEPADEEATEQATGRRRDPELLVMQRIEWMLDDLEEPARGRVVQWLASRYYAAEPRE